MQRKRIFCAVFCAAMLLGVAAVPAAGAAAGCDCGEVVQIYMDGFGSALYFDYGTPAQAEAGIARTDGLASGIWQLLRGAGRSVWQQSWDPLAGGLNALTFSLMGHLAMDTQGSSIAPITNRWRLDPEQNHRTDPEYVFTYDFRIDPFEAAKQLDEFVEAIVKATGHGKIALTGNSEGAAVCMTYLKVYGTKRLDSFILVNGAWQGLTLVGELLTGKFGLSGDAVANYIGNWDDGSGRLKLAMGLLRESRMLDFLEPLGGTLMAQIGDPIYDEILLPLFGTMPVVWAFVPHETYPEARKLLADRPDYAPILAMADQYQSQVQAQAGKLLKDAKAKGVKVAVIAGCGMYPIPVSQNVSFQCDSMIDTAFESGGATTAPLGQTLPPSGSKYRSPDGSIDAATCVLPDQTWFIKNSRHEPGPSYELRQWILHSKKQPTVWENTEWPQYLVNVEGSAVALK